MAAIEIDGISERSGDVAFDTSDGLLDATASGETRYVYAQDLTVVEFALAARFGQQTSPGQEVAA